MSALRSGINWTAVTPPSPVKEIEAARQCVLDLRGRTEEQGSAVEQARDALGAAARADRERMARELADGHDPTSDPKKVEQARAALGAAERKADPLSYAIATAEEQFGAAIQSGRGRRERAQPSASRRPERPARKTLDQLERTVPRTPRRTGGCQLADARPRPRLRASAARHGVQPRHLVALTVG